MDRRNFMAFLTGSAVMLGSKSFLRAETKSNASALDAMNSYIADEVIVSKSERFKPQIERYIKPRGLRPNSLIAITAPASPVNIWEINSTINSLKKQGFRVEVGETIKNQKNGYRYLAAPDEVRAKEFMSYIERKDVDCIICGRGGYGVMRILPMLDYDKIRNNPKIILGYSDITALLLAINVQSNLITYHGPVATSAMDSFTLNNMLSIIKEPKGKNFDIVVNDLQVVNKGQAEGIIQGGNLRLIVSTLGSKYEIDTKDAILFLEDVSEHPYEVDRMLSQLLIAGKLNTCKAIVFGQFKNLNVRKPFYPNKSYTIAEIINQIIKPLNIPTVLGMPFGHIDKMMTLPIGIKANLNTEKRQLKLIETSVA